MKDIETKGDIRALLEVFYERLLADEQMGFIFKNVAHVDFNHHLPLLTDFWSGVVFNDHSYKGNVLQTHAMLHSKHPLGNRHFEKWLAVFQNTLEEMFEGENAARMMNRAISVATVMRLKILPAPSAGDPDLKIGQ